MPHRTTTSPGEATVIVLLCFGWFILVSLDAVSSGFKNPSFTERGVFELVVFEIVVGAFAVYTLKARGFDVGPLYPRPYAWGLVSGALVTVGAGFAGWLVTAPFDYAWYSEPLDRLMSGNPIGVGPLVLLGIVNGTYEEVFLLGFLVRGLRGYGLSVAVGVSLLVRVLYHLYQGPLGAIYVGAFGLVLTLYYVACGRLFPVVLAHALWDIIPFMSDAP